MRLMLIMLQATGASGLWRLVAAADAHDAPAAAMMLQATGASGLWRLVAAADALDAADAHHAPGHRGFWTVEACGST